MMRRAAVWLSMAFTALGCASDYSWRSQVPTDMRSVSVPVFRNESDVTELGGVAARQLLREFQREGTFSIAGPGEGAVEVQGVVKKTSAFTSAYGLKTGMRYSDQEFSAEIDISVIDRKKGRVLVDNRRYIVRTTFTDSGDSITSRRDASGRLAEDLARQVLDDVLNMNWEGDVP